MKQPKNSGMQRHGVESSHDGRRNTGDGPLLRRLLIAHPAEFPTAATIGFERIQCVSRQETRRSLAANAPTAIDEDFSAATETSEKVSGRLFGSKDSSGRCGAHDAHMHDLILIQCGTDRKVCNPWAPFHICRFYAPHLGTGTVDCHIDQLSFRLKTFRHSGNDGIEFPEN